MISIRPLLRQDIPQVASLYESVMRSGSRTPAPRLGAYFERMFLDHPWADPEIPSLVYETKDGGIAGFVGSHVRRLRFAAGEPIRAGYSGPLVSDPAVRNRGVGALLLRRYYAGPQDVTLDDASTIEVRQMCERLGGSTIPLNSLSWTRFFRPFRYGGDSLLNRAGHPVWAPRLRPIWSFFDAIATRTSGTFLRARQPLTRAEQLTPQALLDHLPLIAGGRSVRPDYDETFLNWLFDEMALVKSRGNLVRQLVRDESGRVLGWYVAFLQPGGEGQVQQIVANDDDVAAVIEHLIYHAWQSGAVMLRGRLEPITFVSVRRRGFFLRPDAWVLVHSRNTRLLNAILAGDALLTRMEGAWWMGPHIEAFA